MLLASTEPDFEIPPVLRGRVFQSPSHPNRNDNQHAYQEKLQWEKTTLTWRKHQKRRCWMRRRKSQSRRMKMRTAVLRPAACERECRSRISSLPASKPHCSICQNSDYWQRKKSDMMSQLAEKRKLLQPNSVRYY